MPGLKRPIHCAWDAPATRPPAICRTYSWSTARRTCSQDEPETDDRLEEEERDARDDVCHVEELVDRVRREQDEDQEDDVDPQAPSERLVFVRDRVRRAPDEDGRGGDADCPRQDRRPPAAVDAEAVVIGEASTCDGEAEADACPERELCHRSSRRAPVMPKLYAVTIS